jgi:outer membrane protein
MTRPASKDVSLKQFAEQVVRLMPRMIRLMIREERNYLARGLITLPQLWVMMAVCEQGACTMQDIAQLIGLKASTVTSLVDRLVEMGLVRRQHNHQDRRQVLAMATPKGAKMLEHIREEKEKSVIRMFEALTEKERAAYLSILEKLVAGESEKCGVKKSVKKVVGILLLCLGLGGPVMAGDTGAVVRTYSLDECIDIGLERAVTVLNAKRDEKIAEARIRQVRAQVIPHLSANGEYTRLDEVQSVDLGEGDSVELGKLDNYSVSAEASQLLYSGGSVQAALNAARQYRDRNKHGTFRTQQELIRNIQTSFNDILLAQATVKVAEESVQQLKGLAEQSERKYRNGTASEFDMLSAQVRLANEVPQLIKARRDVDVAKEAFRNLIHIEEESFDLIGELSFTAEDVSPNILQELAMARRPEIHEQEKLIELWKSDIRAEQGGYQPTIRARAAYKGANPGDSFGGEDEWAWHWNAGLTAEWSLFDGGLRSGRVMEKGLELLKAQDNLSELKRSVTLEVKTYHLDLQRAAEAVAASRDNVALAEKSLAIAQARYDAGLSTYLEFTDANLALSRARLTWYAALHEHMNALALIRYACGIEYGQSFK